MNEDLAAKLHSLGYRLTPQRQFVLQAVEKLGHATPDEILAEVQARSSAVNISTVYRTLEVLEELGLVRHTHLSDRAPTYHSITDHEHFHLSAGIATASGRLTQRWSRVRRTAARGAGLRDRRRPPGHLRNLRGV